STLIFRPQQTGHGLHRPVHTDQTPDRNNEFARSTKWRILYVPRADRNLGSHTVNRLPGTPVWMVALLLSTATVAASQSSISLNQSTAPTTAQDTVDVQHVMDAFHEAVTTHDGSRLAALFIPEGSTWLNV